MDNQEEKFYNKGKSLKRQIDDEIYQIHHFDLDYRGNTIFLQGSEEYILPDSEGEEPGVEFAMANRFIRNLHILSAKPGDDPILIKMKTCGGMWSEGMAIHNAIMTCPKEVIILSYTHARSMSSLILQAASKRVLMPDSTFMFHDGTMFDGGTVKQYEVGYHELQKSKKRMMEIYVEKLKQGGKFKRWSRERIETMLREEMDKKEDVFLTAKEAVEWGFADEVFGWDGNYDWEKLLKIE